MANVNLDLVVFGVYGVFIAACGYWSAEAEKRLRAALATGARQ